MDFIFNQTQFDNRNDIYRRGCSKKVGKKRYDVYPDMCKKFPMLTHFAVTN
jgi:hypothetical protein